MIKPLKVWAARLGRLSIGLVMVQLHSASVATELTNPPPVAVWDGSARGTVGVGYRDNVLRTSVAPESSAFFLTAGDVSLMRLSETGSQILLLLWGEDTRYFDSPSVSKEQVLAFTAQGSVPVRAGHELGAMLQYLYQNQIVDASETEANLRRLLVEGHGFTFRPHWKHAMRPGWGWQVEGAMERQIYTADLDDFWEGGCRLSLTHEQGRRSEWSVSFQSRHRFYDTREQFDLNGVAITNSSLVYWRPELTAQWRFHWDESRHWRTTTKVGWLLNRDDGSGYFDYDRVQFAEQLRWSRGDWEVTGQARFGWYLYRRQRVGSEHRDRSYVLLELRAERRLGKHWLLHAAAEREWNFSNDPLDEYRDWMINGGIGVEF
ncbi:MAG: hypothetical protein KIS67_25225 [Verrucomicrobiae bacterium]|nr:hypothetical protein [Verrucomicrobiae bacterium]